MLSASPLPLLSSSSASSASESALTLLHQWLLSCNPFNFRGDANNVLYLPPWLLSMCYVRATLTGMIIIIINFVLVMLNITTSIISIISNSFISIISIILKWCWSLWSSGPNFAFDGFHSGKLCTHTTFHLQAIHHILHNMEGSIEERLPPFCRYLQNVEDVIKDLFLPYALQRERKWASKTV